MEYEHGVKIRIYVDIQSSFKEKIITFWRMGTKNYNSKLSDEMNEHCLDLVKNSVK